MTDLELKQKIDHIFTTLNQVARTLKDLEIYFNPVAQMETYATCECDADYTGLPHSQQCPRWGLK